MDYVEISWDLLSFHKNVTLAADAMFVNSIPFLVLVLRNINLITIEHAPKHCSASKLGYFLQCIINIYTDKGFCVQTILMDNESNKAQDHVPTIDMNTPAASEHIAEIEQWIQVIKERMRSIQCNLLYKCLPPLMLI
jgi:hypothetical protein